MTTRKKSTTIRKPAPKAKAKPARRTVVYRPVYRKGSTFPDLILSLRNWFVTRGPIPFALFVLALVAVTAAFLSSSSTKSRTPATNNPSPNAQVRSLFHTADELTMGERVGMWSASLRDNPKLLSWMENYRARVKNDNVPYIPEVFDCTTFIETVAALARAHDASEVPTQILTIRYKDGEPGWFTRNHFPEADWIPNNQSAGVLKDVTEDLMKRADSEASTVGAHTVAKTIHKRAWFQSQPDYPAGGRGIASLDGLSRKMPEKVDVTLPYIPLDKVAQVMDHIPSGAIVNLVHADDPSKPVLISHQGFFVKRSGKAYFRHAKRTHGIKDSPFLPYIEAQKSRAWRVLGLNINIVEEVAR